MSNKFNEVLLRAERLMQTCEGWPSERWPPERPPATPRSLLSPPAHLQSMHNASSSTGLAASPWGQKAVAVQEPISAAAAAAQQLQAQASSASTRFTHTAEFGQSPSRVAATDVAGNVSSFAGWNATRLDEKRHSPADVSLTSHVGSFSGLRTTESAVVLDSLERENALLRQQLERSTSREKAALLEFEELRRKLELQDQQKHQLDEAETRLHVSETERLRSTVEEQGALAKSMAARVEVLQREHDSHESRTAALQAEITNAQAEMEALIRDVESIQRFVLPTAPIDPSPPSGASLQDLLSRARAAVTSLRLAIDAKLETLGRLHQQLRSRLEVGVGTSRSSEVRRGCLESVQTQTTGATISSSGSAARGLSEERSLVARLEDQLKEARLDVERQRTRADEAIRQLNTEEEECRLKYAKELDAARRALRVREVEVRELQLIGKYFAGRQPPSAQELEAAELAEELRSRVAQLSTELDQLRAERDLLRAERDRADRWAAKQAGSLNTTAGETSLELSGTDLALAMRLLDSKKAAQTSRTGNSSFTGTHVTVGGY